MAREIWKRPAQARLRPSPLGPVGSRASQCWTRGSHSEWNGFGFESVPGEPYVLHWSRYIFSGDEEPWILLSRGVMWNDQSLKKESTGCGLEGNGTRVSGQRGDMNRVSQGMRPLKLTKVTQGVNHGRKRTQSCLHDHLGWPTRKMSLLEYVHTQGCSRHKSQRCLGRGEWSYAVVQEKADTRTQAKTRGHHSPKLSPALAPAHSDAGLCPWEGGQRDTHHEWRRDFGWVLVEEDSRPEQSLGAVQCWGRQLAHRNHAPITREASLPTVLLCFFSNGSEPSLWPSFPCHSGQDWLPFPSSTCITFCPPSHLFLLSITNLTSGVFCTKSPLAPSAFTELPNSYVVCVCDCPRGRAVFSFYLPTQRIDTLEFILGLEKSRPLETDTQGKVYLIQWKINPHSLKWTFYLLLKVGF